MDIASLIGLISGVAFTLLSILIATDYQISGLLAFWDPPSVMITIGGTIAATFFAFPLKNTLTALKAIGIVFKPPSLDFKTSIDRVLRFANVARKDGLLALEGALEEGDDHFFKKGIMLIVDGTDPTLVKNVLETELAYVNSRHSEVRGVWEFIASSAPAWGMIGTLIGLILMLGDMSDIASLGTNMAVALITTFYGSLIANLIANPVANKLKSFNGEEMLLKEVLIEGILSIQAGENPRIVEEKLKAFLAPSFAIGQDDKEDKKEGERDEG